MSKIEIISSFRVNQSSSTAISRVELTPWDLQYLHLDPSQYGLLYYKAAGSDDFHNSYVHPLKKSLSRALDFFPPLAGRLGTVKNEDGTSCYFVNCNDEGAELTHAIAHGVSVSDIISPTYVPETVNQFFPLNGVSNWEGDVKPLLAVQVTELVDGFFLGCSMNHVLVDGSSFWHFLNSWAEISRGADVISKNPVFERWFPSSIEPPIRLPATENGNLIDAFVSGHELKARMFHFSKESVTKLKTSANFEAGCDTITSVQSLLAQIWRFVVRCRQNLTKNPENRMLIFLLPVSARERIPLSDAYFGNAVYGSRFITNKHDLLNHGLGWAALKLSELVARQTREEAIKFVEEWEKNHALQHGKPPKDLNVCLVSNSPRFDVYGNDFGWGKPIAVRSGEGFKVDGRVTVFPAAEAGGVDVEICLSLPTWDAMEDHVKDLTTTE